MWVDIEYKKIFNKKKIFWAKILVLLRQVILDHKKFFASYWHWRCKDLRIWEWTENVSLQNIISHFLILKWLKNKKMHESAVCKCAKEAKISNLSESILCEYCRICYLSRLFIFNEHNQFSRIFLSKLPLCFIVLSRIKLQKNRKIVA